VSIVGLPNPLFAARARKTVVPICELSRLGVVAASAAGTCVPLVAVGSLPLVV
jgi:hypothetical protein